jgi:hypothetical protein
MELKGNTTYFSANIELCFTPLLKVDEAEGLLKRLRDAV